MKLALQGLGLAALGGGSLYYGFAGETQGGAAIVLGIVMMYVGATIAFGELRRMYYLRQKERGGS